MIATVVKGQTTEGVEYDLLCFVCPGCVQMDGTAGIHMLPVNTDAISPSWDWDGNLDRPSVSPSIRSGKPPGKVCHKFLYEGIFQYLADSTHDLKGKHIQAVDLPGWFIEERDMDA